MVDYKILESQLSPLLRMVAKFFGPCPGPSWTDRLAQGIRRAKTGTSPIALSALLNLHVA